MSIRTLDLFCGGGGSSWGAQAAGAEIVCGVDAWGVAVKAYGKNFPSAKVVHLEMTPETHPVELGDIGPIDLLLGSPECTHHTCARGNRQQDEQSKRTAFYVANFAQHLSPRPRWVVIENVVHIRGWKGYQPLISELEELGYQTEVYVLDASRFGVPQSRRRVFIVGDQHQRPPARIPVQPGPAPWVKGILSASGAHQCGPLETPRRAAPTLTRARRAISELGKGVPFLIVYYGSDGSGGWQPVDRPLRTITTLDRFGLVTWEGRKPMLRMLQVEELMAAMGFGEGYSLDGIGTRRDKIRLLGNGVCPPVMSAVVKSLAVSAKSCVRPPAGDLLRYHDLVQCPQPELVIAER
jgi:DNA (cytosine-5)-methyltransferase 1